MFLKNLKNNEQWAVGSAHLDHKGPFLCTQDDSWISDEPRTQQSPEAIRLNPKCRAYSAAWEGPRPPFLLPQTQLFLLHF